MAVDLSRHPQCTTRLLACPSMPVEGHIAVVSHGAWPRWDPSNGRCVTGSMEGADELDGALINTPRLGSLGTV